MEKKFNKCGWCWAIGQPIAWIVKISLSKIKIYCTLSIKVLYQIAHEWMMMMCSVTHSQLHQLTCRPSSAAVSWGHQTGKLWFLNCCSGYSSWGSLLILLELFPGSHSFSVSVRTWLPFKPPKGLGNLQIEHFDKRGLGRVGKHSYSKYINIFPNHNFNFIYIDF